MTQLALPGVPVARMQTAWDRLRAAQEHYNSANLHFERYTASVAQGQPDLTAAQDWWRERSTGDAIANYRG